MQLSKELVDLFTFMASCTYASLDLTKKDWNKLTSGRHAFEGRTLWITLMGFGALYAHIADRLAFQEFGKPQRDGLISSFETFGVIALIRGIYARANEKDTKALVENFIDNFHDAQQAYASCETVRPTDFMQMLLDIQAQNPTVVMNRFCLLLPYHLDIQFDQARFQSLVLTVVGSSYNELKTKVVQAGRKL